MISERLLQEALDGPDGMADVTKIEFEVLESGAMRWVLWDNHRRIFTATFDHTELVNALKMSGVLLWTMCLSYQEWRLGR